MLHTNTKSQSFLTESIEVATNGGYAYLRVATQKKAISADEVEKLRRTKRWILDGVPYEMATKTIAIDKKKGNFIVCLYLPYNNPLPVTIGSLPEKEEIDEPLPETVNPFDQEGMVLDDPDFDPDLPLDELIKKFVK
jgi:hypothetical protein